MEKIQKKLVGWKGKLLSFARKVQLLKAFIQNIPVYYLFMFNIPTYIFEKIEMIQRRFLWLGVEERKTMTLIKWETVCTMKREGGLGIRRIKMFNKALVEKMGWFLLEGEKDWVQIIWAKYLNNKDVFCFHGKKELPHGFVFWNNLLKVRGTLTKGVKVIVGNGLRTDFWEDVWLTGAPLSASDNPQQVRIRLKRSIGKKVSNYLNWEGSKLNWIDFKN